MNARLRWLRSLVLALPCALWLGSAGAAWAEFEEVEHYASVEEMTRASDAVVMGRVLDASPTGGEPETDPSPSCEGYTVTLAIDTVLSGRMTPPDSPEVTVEWYFGVCDLPQIEALQVGKRALLFLRNRGVELSRWGPPSTEAEVTEASKHWRTVIYAATVVEEGGTVHVPDALNAPFLAELEDSSFDALVARVAEIASSIPDTSATQDARPAGTPQGWFVLAGLAAFLIVLARPLRRARA